MFKRVLKYLSAHPVYNSMVHLLIGVGIGILITYPLVVTHPIRWAAVFIGLGVLGHAYPLWIKK
ncbi:hypothetical protein M1403_01780 [Patescibacteria group bacterium]|nr:hypothetical protein [Patescibacteria group bacterium]